MDEHRKPLEYDRTMRPAVTRGQFRLLLLLMLVQVVMTAQSTYAPGLLAQVKAEWADHQARVAQKALEKRNAALEQQCLAFSRPAQTVVWEEDPKLADPLLSQGGYQPLKPYDLSSSPVVALIPPGARLPAPAGIDGILANMAPPLDGGLAFLHGRRSPNGAERLVVVVWAVGRTDLPDALKAAAPPTAQPIEARLSKVHGLIAAARSTGSDPARAAPAPATAELWLRPFGQPLDVPVRWSPPPAPDQPSPLSVQNAELFRVYAGQPDPANAAHFTIDYSLDGVRGTIDGYLKDDGSLALLPRQGAVSAGRWYPHAK